MAQIKDVKADDTKTDSDVTLSVSGIKSELFEKGEKKNVKNEKGKKGEEGKEEKAKEENENDIMLHLSIKPPSDGKRKESVFICVLDISGSMGSAATLASENKTGMDKEMQGEFSRLDLVKHCMNTVISVLNENDHLSIVSFSDNGTIELNLTKMDNKGQNNAKERIKKLQPTSSTNLWDGLKKGLDIAKDEKCKNKNVHLLLLTDGEPNINPAEGIIPALNNYIKKNPLACTIHTFGFGYQLDSSLLNKISIIGTGGYSYIPDASMVGTIFVNFVSNALSTYVNETKVELQSLNKCKIKEIYGYDNEKVDNDDSKMLISLGDISYGQSKDIVIKMSLSSDILKEIKEKSEKDENGDFLLVTLNSSNGDNITNLITSNVNIKNISLDNNKLFNEIYIQYYRLYCVDIIKKCMDMLEADKTDKTFKSVNDLIKNLKSNINNDKNIINDKRIAGIVKDLYVEDKNNNNDGQIYKAFSKSDWYNKWGKHYLPSLLRGHILQQCNNFKDHSVQVYGGKLFRDLQNTSDDIFIKLPAPTPSISKVSYNNNNNNNKNNNYVAPPVNMANYYNVGGGCFHGNGKVKMSDGTFKLIKHIQKNDVIQNNNVTSKIVCVLKIKVNDNQLSLVNVNGLLITPYHPIVWNNQWQFPAHVKQSHVYQCDYVYNFILDNHHIINVNGIQCITLGHQILNHPVLSHSFLGTDKIVNNLKQDFHQPWCEGLIQIDNTQFQRGENGLISYIKPL